MGYVLSSVWSILIMVLMWMPLPHDEIAYFHQMDIVAHLGLFVILGALLSSVSDNPVDEQTIPLLLGLVLGIIVETGQLMVPSRSFRWIDLVLNVVGVPFGALMISNYEQHDECRFDAWVSGLALLGFGFVFVRFDNQIWELATRVLLQRDYLFTGQTFALLTLVPFFSCFLIKRNIPRWLLCTAVEAAVFIPMMDATPLVGLVGFILVSLFLILISIDHGLAMVHGFFHYAVTPLLLLWITGMMIRTEYFQLTLGAWFVVYQLGLGLLHQVRNAITPP